jgi:hypothetical protein
LSLSSIPQAGVQPSLLIEPSSVFKEIIYEEARAPSEVKILEVARNFFSEKTIASIKKSGVLKKIEKIDVLSDIIGGVLDDAISLNRGYYQITCYGRSQIPSISLRDYISRVIKYIKIDYQELTLSLIYLDRISQIMGRDYVINKYNAHRSFLTAILLAVKVHDDNYFSNKHFSEVGGVPLAELNAMEVDFCFGLNFSLYADDDFAEYRGLLFPRELFPDLDKNTLSSPLALLIPDVKSVEKDSKQNKVLIKTSDKKISGLKKKPKEKVKKKPKEKVKKKPITQKAGR